MEKSAHAKIREQQRGFHKEDAELILEYGTPKKKPGDALEFSLSPQKAKQLIRSISRIQNKAVLVSQTSGRVITVYSIK